MRRIMLLIAMGVGTGCSRPAPPLPQPPREADQPTRPIVPTSRQLDVISELRQLLADVGAGLLVLRDQVIAGLVPTPNPTTELTEAFRTFHAGMAAEAKADRIAALNAFLPTPDELKRAFPTKARAVQLIVDTWREELTVNIETLSERYRKHGLLKVKVRNLRDDPINAPEERTRFLKLLAHDVAAYEVDLSLEGGTGEGGICVLRIRGRWVLMPEFDPIPRAVEAIEKKK